MNKIDRLRYAVDQILTEMSDPNERRNAFIHLYGVAQCCALLARKRGLRDDLAIMAGMLHDLYSYKTMTEDNHAYFGSILAKDILTALNITSALETATICTAIERHSDKDVVHSDFDEMLKDADVLAHCLYDTTQPVKEKHLVRFFNLLAEFDMPGTVN